MNVQFVNRGEKLLSQKWESETFARNHDALNRRLEETLAKLVVADFKSTKEPPDPPPVVTTKRGWQLPPSLTQAPPGVSLATLPHLRVDPLRFDGRNVYEWIRNIQIYYNHYYTPLDDRLYLTQYLFDHPASNWRESWEENNKGKSWDDFLLAVKQRFDPEFYDPYTATASPGLFMGTGWTDRDQRQPHRTTAALVAKRQPDRPPPQRTEEVTLEVDRGTPYIVDYSKAATISEVSDCILDSGTALDEQMARLDKEVSKKQVYTSSIPLIIEDVMDSNTMETGCNTRFHGIIHGKEYAAAAPSAATTARANQTADGVAYQTSSEALLPKASHVLDENRKNMDKSGDIDVRIAFDDGQPRKEIHEVESVELIQMHNNPETRNCKGRVISDSTISDQAGTQGDGVYFAALVDNVSIGPPQICRAPLPYISCIMETAAVPDVAVVVDEIQDKSRSEVMLLTTGARGGSFIAECLADELINTTKGSSNSYINQSNSVSITKVARPSVILSSDVIFCGNDGGWVPNALTVENKASEFCGLDVYFDDVERHRENGMKDLLCVYEWLKYYGSGDPMALPIFLVGDDAFLAVEAAQKCPQYVAPPTPSDGNFMESSLEQQPWLSVGDREFFRSEQALSSDGRSIPPIHVATRLHGGFSRDWGPLLTRRAYL